MLLALSHILIIIVVFSAALGVAYRFLVQPAVFYHFGEELHSRRDRETTHRRRSFERNCARSAICLMIAGIVGGLGDSFVPLFPHVAAGVQIVFYLAVGLSIWAAVSRWRAPFED